MNTLEHLIIKTLNSKFLSNPKYMMNNLYVYDYESDYLAITRSGYAYEIEVKISHGDYINDFKKTNRHLSLRKGKDCPNYFFFCSPPGVIKPEEVPPYAGLLEVDMDGKYIRTIVKAPKLHNDKFDVHKYNLVDKFYYNMDAWKRRATQKSTYGDTNKARREGAKAGAVAVRESALEAFAKVCPYVEFDNGFDLPMCGNPEMSGYPMRDCILQCKAGVEFKKLLK